MDNVPSVRRACPKPDKRFMHQDPSFSPKRATSDSQRQPTHGTPPSAPKKLASRYFSPALFQTDDDDEETSCSASSHHSATKSTFKTPSSAAETQLAALVQRALPQTPFIRRCVCCSSAVATPERELDDSYIVPVRLVFSDACEQP